jgi:EAL domain-containing protein (putative c-di-GMP-specific phosphodiesterase class I)
MAHQPYQYLRLLLRNYLLLDLDEYSLIDTGREGLVCNFMGMCLASVFQPVLRADGKVVGREALLRASILEHGELTPDAAFEEAVKANRLVQFDRLVRTIHLLNHSNSFAEHELLFLNVHPRLLTSVSDHGRTFEQILHFYSIPTSHVVIEIKESAVKDAARLEEAVSNYRSLGYKIAVDNFGTAHSSLERMLKLQPDIVKLDGTLIRATEYTPSLTGVISGLVDKFHRGGAQVAITGIESAKQLEIARQFGADLLQGHYLGRPEFAADTRRQLYTTTSHSTKLSNNDSQVAGYADLSY